MSAICRVICGKDRIFDILLVKNFGTKTKLCLQIFQHLSCILKVMYLIIYYFHIHRTLSLTHSGMYL